MTCALATSVVYVLWRRLRCHAELFSLDEAGKLCAIVCPDGKDANEEDLAHDADAWAAHIGWDAFNNHCTNHEHSCTETCVKYVKQKFEAKQSLRSNKVPSCRIWFFRIIKQKKKERSSKRQAACERALRGSVG